MNEKRLSMLIEAIRDLGFGSQRIGEYAAPGVGEKLAMELGRLADEVSGVASALQSIADAIDRSAFRK